MASLINEILPAAEPAPAKTEQNKAQKKAEGRERAKLIAEKRKAEGLVASQKNHNGHGSHNSSRSREFVKWVISTFPLSQKTVDDNTTANPAVLDVAAGNGEISLRLSFCEHIPTAMVDVREADLYNTLMKRIVAKLPKKWQEKLVGKSKEEIEAISSSIDCGSNLPLQIIEPWNTILQVEGSPTLMRALRKSSLLVGMHADASTEPIVQLAQKYNKSYAVVPCCVFPNLFKDRKVVIDGVCRDVRSYEEFVEYLSASDRAERCTLKFDGRNVCIFERSRELFDIGKSVAENAEVVMDVGGAGGVDLLGGCNVYIYVHAEWKDEAWVDAVKERGGEDFKVIALVDEGETEFVLDGVDYYVRYVKEEGETEWQTFLRLKGKGLGGRMRSLISVIKGNDFKAKYENEEEVKTWPVWKSMATTFQESEWWETRPGAVEERCHVISGSATLTIQEENVRTIVSIEAGDRVVFRKGFSCEWSVAEEGIGKFYQYYDERGGIWKQIDK